MNNKIITTAIAASLASILCFAEEAEVAKSKDISLRLSIGTAPSIDTLKNPTGTHPIEEDGASRLELLVVKGLSSEVTSNIGLTFGGGLFLAEYSGYSPTRTTDLSVIGVMTQGGMATKLGNLFIIEGNVYLGLGIAKNETTGFSDGEGLHALYGIKGGIFIAPTKRTKLGFEVGYEGFFQHQGFDAGGGTTYVTYSGDGARGALVFAVNF